MNLSRQITQYNSDIRRIGINYNIMVRSILTLSKLRDKRGNAVVSENTINSKLWDLKILMETILDNVLLLKLEVENLDED